MHPPHRRRPPRALRIFAPPTLGLGLLLSPGTAAAQAAPEQRWGVAVHAAGSDDDAFRTPGGGAELFLTLARGSGRALWALRAEGAATWFPGGPTVVCATAACDTRRVRRVLSASLAALAGPHPGANGARTYAVAGIGRYATRWRGALLDGRGVPIAVAGTGQAGFGGSVGGGFVAAPGGVRLRAELRWHLLDALGEGTSHFITLAIAPVF